MHIVERLSRHGKTVRSNHSLAADGGLLRTRSLLSPRPNAIRRISNHVRASPRAESPANERFWHDSCYREARQNCMNAFPMAKANFQTWDSHFECPSPQPQGASPKIAGTIAQAPRLVKTQLDQSQKMSVPKPSLPDILARRSPPSSFQRQSLGRLGTPAFAALRARLVSN